MAKRPDTPCAGCGALLWSGPTSLPVGERMCRPCRAARPRAPRPPRPSSIRTPPPRRPPRLCEVCGQSYKRSYSKQRTCGRACGWALRVREGNDAVPRRQRVEPDSCPVYYSDCPGCGVTLIAPYRTTRPRHCTPECRSGRTPRPCPCCGVTFNPAHGGQRYCQPRCARRFNKRRETGKNHRKRARHFGVRYEPVKREYIYERDRWVCGICRTRIRKDLPFPDPMSPSLDHILPMSCGGDHVASNLQAAHLICNSLKSAGTTHAGEQLLLVG